MREISLRTIGASLVLLGLAFAALVQMTPGGDRNAVALIPEETVNSSLPTVSESVAADGEASTTPTTPFNYRVGVLAGISTNNFWAFYGQQPSVWNSYILGPTKPALFRVTSSALEPEVAKWLPGLSYEGDSWFVEVVLREDMYWSDGTPITADDYVFTFETVRSLELGASWAAAFPGSIAGVKALAPHRLRIEFTDKPAFAAWPNAAGTAPIMPKHVWEGIVPGLTAADLYADSSAADVAGGPLVLSEVADGHITSVANPGYPLQNGPDTVVYTVYPDEQTLVDALIADEIDAILTPKGLSEGSSSRVQGDDTIRLLTSPANGIRYLGFNLQREPMSDPAFRQALALLVDREALAGVVGIGARPAYTFTREANEAWYESESALAIGNGVSGDLQSRLTQAIAALKGAGYVWQTEPALTDDGGATPGAGLTINGLTPAPLTILTPGDSYDPSRPAYVTEIAATLALLGFDARPVVTDFDTVVDLAFTGGDEGVRQYDMYLLGWTLGNPALPDFFRPLFHSQGEMNNTGYASTEFDERLAAYEAARTSNEARSHLWEMEGILARDLPYLVLYSMDITEAYRADRVEFAITGYLGGLQGRLGGIGDVRPVSR